MTAAYSLLTTIKYLRRRLEDIDKPNTICHIWNDKIPTIKSILNQTDQGIHNPSHVRKQVNRARFHLETCGRCLSRAKHNKQLQNASNNFSPTKPPENEPIILEIKENQRHTCHICNVAIKTNLVQHLITIHNHSPEVAQNLKYTHPALFASGTTKDQTRKRKNTFKEPAEPLTKIIPTTTNYPITIQTPSHQCNTCNTLPPSDTKIQHLLQEHQEFFINTKLHNLMTLSTDTQTDLPIKNPPTRYPTDTTSMCALCLFQFETPQLLDQHLNENHADILIPFQTLVKTHHSFRLHKCNLCDQSYYWGNNLKIHIQTTHKIGKTTRHLWQFPCPQHITNSRCPIFALKMEDLVRHIRNFHEKEITIQRLMSHTNSTPIIPFYKCNICICSFFTLPHLSNHIATAHSSHENSIYTNRKRLLNVSPYRCNACCNAKFLDLNTLTQHHNKQQQTPCRE